MFPDSKIAKEYACAHTKVAALITHALAPASVIEACQKLPFTILCDGGNDNFEKKYFGIMVRFWSKEINKIVTRFLDAPIVNIVTGATLFKAMDEVLNIPWRNVVGFASDSASVMVGKRNSVLSRVIQQQYIYSPWVVCVTLLPCVLLVA